MESSETAPSRAKDFGVALFIALAVFGLSAAWKDASNSVGVDFYLFWVDAQSLRRPDVTNIYSEAACVRLGGEYLEKARRNGPPRLLAVAQYRQKLEAYSSPFLYSVMRLFSNPDYETAWKSYRLFLLVCFGSSIIVLARVLHYSWNTTLAAVALFSGWFGPFSSEITVGNVNSIQLAALAVFAWVVTRMRWRHRDLLGGFIMGLVVVFKPNILLVPGIIAINWIFNGRVNRLWPHIAGAVIAVIVAVVVASATFGSTRCWTDWISALRLVPFQEHFPVMHGNFAPSQLLFESLGIDVGWLLAVILGFLVLAGLWIQRTDLSGQSKPGIRWDGFSDTLALSIGCLMVVLAQKLAWEHYYLLTIPAFLFLLKPFGSASGSLSPVRQVLVGLALFSVAVNPFHPPLSISPNGIGQLVVFGTLILLLVAVLPPEAFER